MAVATVKEVVSALLRSGRPKNEPCAFIEQGTTPAERIIYGRLGNIAEKARRSSLRAPAVFIVGKVVDYGRKLYAHKFNPQDHALERKGIGRGHETSEEKYGKHGY
jgi:siroheme synthase